MAFTAAELANISASSLETYLQRGTVFKQNVSNKPMLKAFDAARGSFPGGKDYVSLGVKSGQGGGSLTGYSGDDRLTYYRSANNKRAKYPWKEHFIGQVVEHTELKIDGIDVVEDGADQSVSPMEGREAQVLANLLDEKNDELGEDYAASLDTLIHGDGTSDTKALAGIRAFILDDPSSGTTGGLSRANLSWWRNRAATAAANSAGSGDNKITSASTGGGVLLQYMQKQFRLLSRYAQSGVRHKIFCGSDFYDAMESELRANGSYTNEGFMRKEAVDGGMAELYFKGNRIEWDPTMDDLSRGKFCNIIDMKRIRLMYMNGQRMKKHKPARPYDRMVMYNGISTTAVMVAQQLNTSMVIEIN